MPDQSRIDLSHGSTVGTLVARDVKLPPAWHPHGLRFGGLSPKGTRHRESQMSNTTAALNKVSYPQNWAIVATKLLNSCHGGKLQLVAERL